MNQRTKFNNSARGQSNCVRGLALELLAGVLLTGVLLTGVLLTGVLLIGCGRASDNAGSTGSTDSATSRSTGSTDGSTSRAKASTTADLPRSSTPSTPTANPATTTASSLATAPPSTSAPPEASAQRPLTGVVVALDPGHNGANGANRAQTSRLVDAGGFKKACNTTGTGEGGYSESTFNLDVANRVKERLEESGATVVMTRTDDSGWGPCIDERGQIAARAHAAALISIHADGASAGNHGFHIIHPSPTHGVSKAIADQSTVIATALRDELVAQGWDPSNYVGSGGLNQRGDLGTLNRADVPAVMLEAGNMHNSADLALLQSSEGQDRLATAMLQMLERIMSREGTGN